MGPLSREYSIIHNKLLMSQSRSFQTLSEVTTQQILEPIVEAMKSPSDEELDYSSDSSECRTVLALNFFN